MKVTIENTIVNEKPWQKGDRSGVIRTQEAIFETRRMRNVGRLDLPKDQLAYAIGTYEVDLEDNIQINNFGEPSLARRLKLVRQGDAGRKAA